ncbi:MAG: peptide-methionine (R)-S-oxide reductase MsrB [Novosphingobium sp.]
MLDRRRLLGWFGASVCGGAIAACGSGAEAKGFPVRFSEAEWRKRLSREQFYVLRQKGTEVPGTSPLLHEKRRGTFVCAADGHPLFASETKYDSKTGWPSFWRPLPGAIGTATDWEVGYPRTEVHCARCGGHLGHVFDDGPRPTGKRYCMNGDAMVFRAA